MIGAFVEVRPAKDGRSRLPVGYVLDGNGCWLWAGGQNGAGYGALRVGGRKVLAHRVMYEAVHGPIPPRLDLDHRCRTPLCVNPAHLEPVTHRDNLLRGDTITADHAHRTHCPRGHLLAGENLRACTLRNRGRRECRICYNAQRRERTA